jgi:hypothetical protein
VRLTCTDHRVIEILGLRPSNRLPRKTALFRATKIFQKVTKVVVNSQINVSFSSAPI